MPTQRKCRGREGRNCNRFMSNLDMDGHLLCSSCRGQTCSKERTCAECENWTDSQWSKYLSRRNTYQERKDKKTSSSSESGSSLSMPNLSLQVTPKISKKSIPSDDSSRRNVCSTPQSSSSKSSIIPDTPRTNALRAEFSNQIAVLREENQRNMQQLFDLTSRMLPPSSSPTKSSSNKSPGFFKTPPSVQSVALATTVDQTAAKRKSVQREETASAVDRQPAVLSEFDNSDFVSIYVEEDVLSLIPSEREQSPIPKKRKVSPLKKKRNNPPSPIKPPTPDLPRIPKKSRQTSPDKSDRTPGTASTRQSEHSSRSKEASRDGHRSSSDRSYSPSRRHSPARSVNRRNYQESNRQVTPDRQSTYRRVEHRGNTDKSSRYYSPERYRNRHIENDRPSSPPRFRSPTRSYHSRNFDRDSRSLRHSSPTISCHSRKRYHDDKHDKDYSGDRDYRTSSSQVREKNLPDNFGSSCRESSIPKESTDDAFDIDSQDVQLQKNYVSRHNQMDDIHNQIQITVNQLQHTENEDRVVTDGEEHDMSVEEINQEKNFTEQLFQDKVGLVGNQPDTRVVCMENQPEETIPEFVSSSEAQDSSYIDVLCWIQEQFPDTVEKLPPSKSSGSLVESLFGVAKTSSSLPALPWSKGCVDAALDSDSILKGSASNREKPGRNKESYSDKPAPIFFNYSQLCEVATSCAT